MEATITSPQNEKLKLVRRLADRRGRESEGLFSGEGEDLLAAALRAGSQPVLVLIVAGHRAPAGVEGPVVEVDPALLGQVSALGSGSRVISVFERPAGPPEPEVDEVLQVYLDGVSDPGNVGTIIRSAEALCGARVVLGPGCADPFGPKAVRASMGALFASPPAAGVPSQTPAPRLGLAAHDGLELDSALGEVAPRTVCLGAERDGLGAEALAACQALATIPVVGEAESLNVAATAAIVLHRISSTSSAAAEPGDTDA